MRVFLDMPNSMSLSETSISIAHELNHLLKSGRLRLLEASDNTQRNNIREAWMQLFCTDWHLKDDFTTLLHSGFFPCTIEPCCEGSIPHFSSLILSADSVAQFYRQHFNSFGRPIIIDSVESYRTELRETANSGVIVNIIDRYLIRTNWKDTDEGTVRKQIWRRLVNLGALVFVMTDGFQSGNPRKVSFISEAQSFMDFKHQGNADWVRTTLAPDGTVNWKKLQGRYWKQWLELRWPMLERIWKEGLEVLEELAQPANLKVEIQDATKCHPKLGGANKILPHDRFISISAGMSRRWFLSSAGFCLYHPNDTLVEAPVFSAELLRDTIEKMLARQEPSPTWMVEVSDASQLERGFRAHTIGQFIHKDLPSA